MIRTPGIGWAIVLVATLGMIFLGGIAGGGPFGQTADVAAQLTAVKLPDPIADGKVSVEKALAGRRSVRQFADDPLTLGQVGQLLWAAQGITNQQGFRTAPSAGALYPLEVYLVAGNITDLPTGIYRYQPKGQMIEPVAPGDVREDLAEAALRQMWIKNAPAVIVIAGDYERTARKYGQRAERYVHIEAGHAAQNIYLQAVPLELGLTFVGAFNDDQVKAVVRLAENEQPLGILPVGRLNKSAQAREGSPATHEQ